MISEQVLSAKIKPKPCIILCYKLTLKNTAFLKNILTIMDFSLIPEITRYNNSLNLYVCQNSKITHHIISITYDPSFFAKNFQFLTQYIKGKKNIFCFLINSNFKKYEPFIIELTSFFPNNTLYYITTSPAFLRKTGMHKGKKFIHILFEKPQSFPSLVLKLNIDVPDDRFLNKKRKLRIDKSNKRLEGDLVNMKKINNSSNDYESDSSIEDLDEPITARNILILLTEKVYRFIQESETSITEVTNYILKLLSRNGRSINHKNIERRVYDIINVMKASGVLSKNKASIITFINKDNQNEIINNAIDNINDTDIDIDSDMNKTKERQITLLKIKQSIEEKKVKLIQHCRELLFYKTIISKNKVEAITKRNRSSSTPQLGFPIYLFKCNETMSIKQNGNNTKVVVVSKEKIDLLYPNDLIEAFTLHNFNINTMKDIVSQGIYKYLDENNLMSYNYPTNKEEEIFSNEDGRKENSFLCEQKSFDHFRHLETDSVNDILEKDSDYNMNNMVFIKHQDSPENSLYCFSFHQD